MNRKKTEADRKLLKLLESDGDEAVLGDEFKSELVKQIMIKSVESDEYCASGRALCTQCKTLLSATDGGHVFRHLDRCTGKRAASEPIPETSDESLRSSEKIEEYWSRKRLDYPALYTVATKVLSIVPSESVCETTFSTAAFLLDKRRTRLRTETVEKIVVGSQIASKNPDWVDDLKTN